MFGCVSIVTVFLFDRLRKSLWKDVFHVHRCFARVATVRAMPRNTVRTRWDRLGECTMAGGSGLLPPGMLTVCIGVYCRAQRTCAACPRRYTPTRCRLPLCGPCIKLYVKHELHRDSHGVWHACPAPTPVLPPSTSLSLLRTPTYASASASASPSRSCRVRRGTIASRRRDGCAKKC